MASLTLMLALTGKLLAKDRITRQGPEGWARRGEHMGMGVVGRTLGQLGIGNIGAEVFRLARPFDMTFIAHDPFVDPKVVAEGDWNHYGRFHVGPGETLGVIMNPLTDAPTPIDDRHLEELGLRVLPPAE